MTWRWVAVRGQGVKHVLHLIAGWRQVTAVETRYDTACGSPDAVDTEITPGGDEYCLGCRRRSLVVGGPPDA